MMEALACQEPPTRSFEPAAPQTHILVVDDENGPRQSLRMLLNETYHVILASGVDEALAMLEHNDVDIIITDIRMPRKTGLDLLREVRVRHPHIEVIVLTGYGALDSAMTAIDYGAFAYVEKPFDNEAMLEKIRACEAHSREQRERRLMAERAVEANRFETFGHLVSSTMHDLGTPLSIIGTHLDLIVANPGKANLDQRIETMRSQVRHCNELVHSTMRFLRQPKTPKSRFKLNTVIELCLDVARPLLLRHEVLVLAGLSPSIPSCEGDLVLVRQAILNLIYNACQAMCEQEQPRQLEIQTWNEEGHVCVAVRDTGPGVPEEDREHVFETLYSTRPEGTGLGLALVRRVMEQHGGQAIVAPHAGRGARFVLRFPAVSET